MQERHIEHKRYFETWSNFSNSTKSKRRIASIDYLKCVYIILMVVFHLAYFGDKYPYIKQIVYTFHMPAFLIISGYLANIRKEKKQFAFSIIWLFIPYTIMEMGYVAMSSILPVRENIENISIPLLLNKVFIAPIGPYWYLHTLIICYSVYYAAYNVCFRINKISFFIVLGTSFWAFSDWFHIISMANAIYFLIGIIISQCRLSFLSVFQPSILGALPLLILCWHPTNLNRYSLAGIIITYSSICFFLWGYYRISNKIKSILHFIGRNTLPILLFSPIFTMISKVLIPLFTFDPSGLIFTCIAVSFVISGSMSIAWCMDYMNVSHYFCGKKNLLIHSS